MKPLEEEQKAATDLLRDKVVKNIKRPNTRELMIEFTDGTRLYVNESDVGLDLSVTHGRGR